MRALVRTALIVSGALLIGAATWSIVRHGLLVPEAHLPVLGQVPEFSLIESDGRPLSRAQLAGGVWVADFIFTRCPGVCPLLSAQMSKLQHLLPAQGADAVRLVSFSVDPTNDTPEALRAYAERFGAQQGRWLFVTGQRDALYTLIGEGFHLAVADRPEGENTNGEGLITHSDRFVLIDKDLQIRGYYHGTDQESVQRLLQDVRQLGKEDAKRKT
jgi:protein SCO1/2